MKEIKGESSGLKGLTTYSFDGCDIKGAFLRYQQRVAAYKQKYGDGWQEKYNANYSRSVDYDVDLKSLNEAVYAGQCPLVSDSGVFRMSVGYDRRMREIYGTRYDELKDHVYKDSEVARLLVEDAVKTGKWKELPDELQDSYFTLVGCDLK